MGCRSVIMLAAFQPPRRPGNSRPGIHRASPGMVYAGAFPQDLNRRASGVFAMFRKAGAEQTSLPVRWGRAGRRGAFQRRVPFACLRGGPSSSPCSVLTAVSFLSPFRASGKELPENVPRRFGPPESRSPCRVCFRRLSLRSRSVPSGQAMVCVFRLSAAAFPTPVVKNALMDIGQKPDH